MAIGKCAVGTYLQRFCSTRRVMYLILHILLIVFFHNMYFFYNANHGTQCFVHMLLLHISAVTLSQRSILNGTCMTCHSRIDRCCVNYLMIAPQGWQEVTAETCGSNIMNKRWCALVGVIKKNIDCVVLCFGYIYCLRGSERSLPLTKHTASFS